MGKVASSIDFDVAEEAFQIHTRMSSGLKLLRDPEDGPSLLFLLLGEQGECRSPWTMGTIEGCGLKMDRTFCPFYSTWNIFA